MPIVSEPLGRVLGNRYRLVAALGSGASAHVFLAEDMVLQRRVAVKVLQPALARDEAFLRRFRAEARSVAALNHPHVLRVFDWGEGEDGPYLVLEYLEGGSLFDMLARGRRLSPAQAARVGAQAADGLAYAHARGIVHRDVKPANILFDEEGRVRVADFGVARALSSASTTDPGTMLATVRYASPEQAQGQQLDGRSDVYSLGLVLYEGVTGTVPFVGDTPHATLEARVGARLPANPGLGPLAPVLAAACAPELDDRPVATQLAARLDVLADELPAGGSLPLVRRGPVEEAGLGLPSAGDPRLGAPARDDLTLAGTTAVAAGFASSGAGGGPGTARGIGVGLVDTGEPTATIKVGDRAAPVVIQTFRRRRPPRRWPWIVALVVVVACLVAAGVVYLLKSRILTASYLVPSVVHRTVTTARQTLRAHHFKVKVNPAVKSTKVARGRVIRQIPAAGVTRKQGSTVQIVPSAGRPSVRVPKLSSDMDCTVVRQLLAATHLHARCPAHSTYSASVPKGNVLEWSYGGTFEPSKVPYGATISVTISEGRAPVHVPSFAGQPYNQAAATLSADGLVVKETEAYSTKVAAGKVIGTTPPAGATLPSGTGITVTVSKGPSEVAVPTVIGLTVSQATAAIQAAGLSVGHVYGPATGVVFTTDPLKGQKEKLGTAVDLYTETPPSTGNGPKPSSGTGTGTSTGAGTAGG